MAEGTIESGTPAPDTGEPTPTPEPKTFTQDDLNRIEGWVYEADFKVSLVLH